MTLILIRDDNHKEVHITLNPRELDPKKWTLPQFVKIFIEPAIWHLFPAFKDPSLSLAPPVKKT